MTLISKGSIIAEDGFYDHYELVIDDESPTISCPLEEGIIMYENFNYHILITNIFCEDKGPK